MKPRRQRGTLWLARAGYAGRGVVFLILGGFAGWAALGHASRPVGTTGALHSLLATPAGWTLAAPTVIGLVCFAAFRALEAIADLHGYGDDLYGALHRAALAAGGLFYAGLAAVAASIVLGWDVARSDDATVRDWTAWLLGMPGGGILVAIAGFATVATGVGLVVSALRQTFKQRVRLEPKPRPYVTAIGIVGMVARAVVFLLVGAFLVFAAVTSDPQQAEGFSGALATIEQQPYGRPLLGATAMGLIAFGLFGVSEALFAVPERKQKKRRR